MYVNKLRELTLLDYYELSVEKLEETYLLKFYIFFIFSFPPFHVITIGSKGLMVDFHARLFKELRSHADKKNYRPIYI